MQSTANVFKIVGWVAAGETTKLSSLIDQAASLELIIEIPPKKWRISNPRRRQPADLRLQPFLNINI